MPPRDKDYGSVMPSGTGAPDADAYNYKRIYRRRSSLEVYRTFLGEFRASNGGWLIILLGFLTAFGIAGLVGVIPQVAMQRFAQTHFGLDPDILCSSFRAQELPLACHQGRDYAQGAASYSALVTSLLAIVLNSVAGSYSDTHGRRGVQILCIFFTVLSPISFWVIQISDQINPMWFYVMESFSGIINYFSIAFIQLSDIMPPKHRAAAYGLYFGSYMAGVAIAPFMATLLSHVHIALFSSIVRILALLIAIFCMPETLPPEHRMAATAVIPHHSVADNADTTLGKLRNIGQLMFAPIYKMEILLRSPSLILVTIGAFCSKMVHSGDRTLFFYYIESNLGATDRDVAGMMFFVGVLCILVQAGFLKYLISLLGERRLLITSFACGTVHTLIYGLAPAKGFMYVGLTFSAFASMDSALLSSTASRSVAQTEQGQIQGALFGLGSLAEAIGPISMNFVYRHWHTFGPGTMFVVGAMIYASGGVAVSLVPPPPPKNKLAMDPWDDDDDEDDYDDDDNNSNETMENLSGTHEEKAGLVA